MAKPLTIGIDVRDLRFAQTGTKTYLEELCKEFKKIDDPEIRFYFLDAGQRLFSGKKKSRLLTHLRYQFWKQITLPLKAFFKGCDIVFCTDSCVPLLSPGYKTIPVFHDAFIFETPENYGKLWLRLYKATAVRAAKHSPFVITPTYYAQKQIHQFTGIPFERLPVVYEAAKSAGDLNITASAARVLEKHNIKPNAYLLHTGAMFKRKNLPFLVRGFAQIKKQHPGLKLVLAGPTSVSEAESDLENIKQTITSAGLENDIIMPGYLSNEDVTLLYQNALLYIFPSLNEGFGLPVLEAFKYQLPVLVADNTCLPEVGADAVLGFDPFDENGLVAKINMVLDNENQRQRMIHNGLKRLDDFSWQKAALQLIEIFKQAARHS